MSLWKLFLAGLAVPLAGAALTLSPATAGPVTCSIRSAPVAGGIRLEAVATTAKTLTGHYRLSIGGNGNTIVQAGDFEAAAGAENVLSTVVLGHEAGETFEARLTVDWSGGSSTCEVSGPGPI